jgi:hypothetical protein
MQLILDKENWEGLLKKETREWDLEHVNLHPTQAHNKTHVCIK